MGSLVRSRMFDCPAICGNLQIAMYSVDIKLNRLRLLNRVEFNSVLFKRPPSFINVEFEWEFYQVLNSRMPNLGIPPEALCRSAELQGCRFQNLGVDQELGAQVSSCPAFFHKSAWSLVPRPGMPQ